LASDLSPADLPFLDGLAHSPRATDRLLWLRVATDYILSPCSGGDGRRAEFVASICEGLRKADDATRYAVARKLAPCAEAGDVLSVLDSLGGEASLYALRRAVALPRELLLDAARSDNARSRAVARREDLDVELVGLLVEHDEIEVLLALARNRRAPIEARMFGRLARQARLRIDASLDRRLALALLERAPIGVEHAALFLEADSGRRAEIMVAAQRAALGGWRAQGRARASRDSQHSIEQLERFALEAEPERFAATLAVALECPADLANAIARDRGGEPLAVALAALRMPDDVTVRILTSRAMQEGGDYRRIGALARFKDALNPAAAELLLAALVGEPSRSQLHRETALDPTASPTPSRPLGATSSAPRNWLKAADLTPAALRRRRAFAFASGRRLDESA